MNSVFCLLPPVSNVEFRRQEAENEKYNHKINIHEENY